MDAVVNFAAESHVDRSILDSSEFVRTNILGTLNLLDCSRKHRIRRFVQISTDEVYGSLGPAGAFTESSPLAPNSPYAASKAAADLLVRSYHHTYGFPAIITRCSNNYGPFQFPEKLIPLLITNALAGMPLPIYGDGLYVRDWIHVRDHCAAIDRVLHRRTTGEIYNIGARQEMPNLEIARLILKTLGKGEGLIKHVEDRPGHDRRYAIDPSKLERELGWRPGIPVPGWSGRHDPLVPGEPGLGGRTCAAANTRPTTIACTASASARSGSSDPCGADTGSLVAGRATQVLDIRAVPSRGSVGPAMSPGRRIQVQVDVQVTGLRQQVQDENRDRRGAGNARHGPGARVQRQE